jgi:FkbM family methyltransferase
MDFQVSYAQNREDFLIAAFFPDVEAGHYVDVGAGHPEEQSVTKLLYDRGWSGINIEPIPELSEALQAERPRDVTLQVALAATAGEATFRQYTGWGLSTLNPEMAAEHQAHPTSWTEQYTEYSVQTVTLADVLEDHPLPHVHVFKVDVEGAEYDALAGADWERFRPDLVCIETEHIRKDWYPILHAAGYEQVFHDGLNGYLLSAEARHRGEYFDYAGTVLNGPTIVTPAEAAELEAAAQLRIDVATVRHEAATAQLEDQAEKDALRATIAARDAAVAQLAATVGERDATIAELDATASDLTSALVAESELREMYAARHADAAARLATTESYLTEILGSTSWRITYPLRRSVEILRARLPRRVLARLWRRFRMPPKPVPAASVDGQDPLMSPDGADVLVRMRELE